MKILLLLYGDVNVNGIKCTKKIQIKKKPYYNFKEIESTIRQYDYMIFLDDNWDYSKCVESINKSVDLMGEYGQIIYEKSDVNGEKVWQYKEKKVKYDIYKSITRGNRIFKGLSKKDMKQSNGIDYEEFVEKKFKNNRFRLVPSVIDVRKFMMDDFSLRKNAHMEDMYGKFLEGRGFRVGRMVVIMGRMREEGVLYDNRDGENMTIVSGFLRLPIKRPPKKDTPAQVYDYVEKARATLMIPQKMVLYLTVETVDVVRRIREEVGLMDRTMIVEVKLEDWLYMYGEMDRVRENVRKNESPYDIGEYICAVNSRYGFVGDAIRRNYFGTDYFGWVDFSAGHIVDIPKDMRITYSQHEKVRIGWIARHNREGFVYNHYCLGGGIFVGHKEIMMELVRIHDEKFRELMDMGYNINDDKLLFTIMERYPYMFDLYFSGYGGLYRKL